MRRALIGHTGFVGGNLARQTTFDAFFHSRDIESIANQSFDLVVCAGAPAAKWIANREPEADKASLSRLFESLAKARCEDVVLISTIDVYPSTRDADESFDCHAGTNHAYGANRLWLEDRVRERFARTTVLRLPALFGTGLKKNIIYDLLHDNCVEMINPRSSFQWYGLDRLWSDVEIARAERLALANLFTEPVGTETILERFFPGVVVGGKAGAEAHYDLRTLHSQAFGGANGYIEGAESVLAAIGRYVERARLERSS